MASRTQAVVHNEDCDIVYWSQGQGPLITFIPGGNGHGRQYYPIMDALSGQFTCATFDRRQMSASKAKVNRQFDGPQQARDVLAVIKALGFDKSIIFGNSAGGLIAFQFAVDHPQIVDRLISHEGPTVIHSPDADEHREWVRRLLEIRDAQGIPAAQEEFSKRLIGYDDEGVPKTAKPEDHNVTNFWEHELSAISDFTPDLGKIKQNGTKVGLMTGLRSRDA